MSVVVIKIGGSLLDLPDLGPRLTRLLQRFSQDPDDVRKREFLPLLVVGGGALADVVRDWDTTYRLGEEVSHRLAMATLAVNEMLLSQLLPNAVRVGNREEADAAWREDRSPVLKTADFLESEEFHSAIEPVPHNWTVTSDSLAAWIAAVWPASRLLLMKSTDASVDLAMSEWPAQNLVDAYFPQVMSRIPQIDWINLRAEEYSSPACASVRESRERA